MKLLILTFFIAAVSATSNFDLSKVETKKLYVPENREQFLQSTSDVVEKTKDGRIANGTDAVDGQFPYAVKKRCLENSNYFLKLFFRFAYRFLKLMAQFSCAVP